jgi:hypothetical protein
MTDLPNGKAQPFRPVPDDDIPETWDEEVIEELPEDEQEEPVPPS